MDDATGRITSAILVEKEGTMSSFLGLAETLAEHGRPCSLTTDRGSHCPWRARAGGAPIRAEGLSPGLARHLTQAP